MKAGVNAAHRRISPFKVSPQNSEQTRWFAEEVQPHEPALRAYLHSRFPSLRDQDDLVQETYARLLTAKQGGKLRYARGFLFTAARNAALDFFRRKRVVSSEPITDSRELFVLDDKAGAPEIVSHQQELEILRAAVQTLPERCRQVMILRYFEGLTPAEIGVLLGISPETVKVQITKGFHRCADYFEARGLLKTGAPK